ncbi:NAD(P)H-binding protein [Labilithrix luteola]|nr:NAD(P)H-binding protein [Labilithrix luteola]
MRTSLETFLVVGGTGKTGRRVAQKLAARGHAVRIGSRSSSPSFDWKEQNSWTHALDGVTAVYLTYYPDLAVPGASDDVARFVKLAVERGVSRIVLLSGRGEPQVLPAEKAVRECGASFTILRAAWFSQNFSEGHLLDPLRGGELAFPAGNVAEPFLDAEDIADVAVEALTDERHNGHIYELTGPKLLTFAEAVGEIAKASGRDLRYVPVTSEEYAQALAAFMPAPEASFLTDLFRHVLDGHNSHLTDGVQRVLGRSPRDFASYAREAAATGVWNA